MSPAPLPSDPQRQAQGMLRGCEYQVWQTVAAWIDLKGDEVLFVEMAEDFDIVGSGVPSTVQVKVSDTSLSLNRPDVLEAIDNYWKLRGRVKGGRVLFRYLAQGKRAVERNKPFGAKIRGLDLWMRRGIADEQVLLLRDFLAQRQKLSPELRNWLSSASAKEVREELIANISWESESESVDQLIRGIHRRLCDWSCCIIAAKQSQRHLLGKALTDESFIVCHIRDGCIDCIRSFHRQFQHLRKPGSVSLSKN